MKRLILLSVIIFLFFEIGNAQCKYKKYKKSIPYSNKVCFSDSKPEVIVASPLVILDRGMKTAYAYLFCKSKDDNTYLYLNIGTNWEIFELRETNPVILKFDDKTEITIYPNGDYTGKKSGMQGFQIAAFYKINSEQLEKFSTNLLTNLQIYFLDDEKPNANTFFNDDGSAYYNIDILKIEKAEKFMETADCMRNYK